MKTARRVILFLALNFLIVMTLSVILRLLGVQPYLNQYNLNYTDLAIFCLIWGMGGAFISLALSRKMAKWMMRIELVSLSSSLYSTVSRLAKKAGLKHVPEVGIFPSEQINAFATGPTQKRSLVAVSSALLSRLNQPEIEAIIGHELAHIANGDMITMTLLQGVVNAFVMFLARVLAFALSAAGRGNQKQSSSGSYFIFVIVFQMIFMILGSMLICAYSRWREFRADRKGAQLSTKKNMISALEHLKNQRVSKAPESIRAFMISTPSARKGWRMLFATHPSIEERIARLKAM